MVANAHKTLERLRESKALGLLCSWQLKAPAIEVSNALSYT